MKMNKYVVTITVLIISLNMFNESSAHSLFNSAESIIGNYKVQIATLPEIPTTGEKSQILFRINNFDNENGFKMGVRIFYDDVQIDHIKPMYHKGNQLEMDYVFNKSGNHIFKVDLYKNNNVESTYTFNISTHNPFGYIFFYSIASGSIGLSCIILYIYISRKKLSAN